MSGETRLKGAAIGAALAMLAGFGIVEALDQFGAPPLLAAFFPALPLLIALLAAVTTRSLFFSDMIRGGALGETASSWALAGLALGAVPLIAAPMATALGGPGGVFLIAAFLGGLAIAWFLIAPMLRATEAPTLSAALSMRFDNGVGILAALAIVLTLLPLLAAEASLAGMLASRMLGLDHAAARNTLIVLATLACLFGGLRAALVMAALSAPIIAVAYLLPLAIVTSDLNGLPLPWLGLLQSDAAAATRFPGTIFLALLVGLLAGVGTMPALLPQAWSTRKRKKNQRSRTTALMILAAVVLAAPSYATLGARLGIDAAANPAGLVIDFGARAELSAAPSVLLIGGLLLAALVSATALLAGAATAIGNDLYRALVEPTAPEGRRVFMARLGMVLIGALAAGLCAATADNAALMATAGLSIGAASLGPVLLFGWRIATVGPVAAAAAIAVGLLLTVGDIALALLLPDISGRFFGMGTLAPTLLGPTGWFGVPVGLSALPGLVFGMLTLWAVTELPRTDWTRLLARARSGTAMLAARPKATPVQAGSRPSPDAAGQTVSIGAGSDTVASPEDPAGSVGPQGPNAPSTTAITSADPAANPDSKGVSPEPGATAPDPLSASSAPTSAADNTSP